MPRNLQWQFSASKFPDNVEIAQRSDPNDLEDKPSAGGKTVILYEPFNITIQFSTEIGRSIKFIAVRI